MLQQNPMHFTETMKHIAVNVFELIKNSLVFQEIKSSSYRFSSVISAFLTGI